MAKKDPSPAKKKVSKPSPKAAPKALKKVSVKAVKAKANSKSKSVTKSKLPAKKAPSRVAPAKAVAKKSSPSKALPSKTKTKAKGKTAVKTVKVVATQNKTSVVKSSSKTAASKKPTYSSHPDERVLAQQFIRKPLQNKSLKLTPFLTKQRQRLLELKDTLLDAMRGVARDNLHAGSETSAFGMHQADAGSDAYDRDFALSMLSKEQGSLYEIDEALKRIEDGTYGVCENCEKPIRHDRLEALPFTRFTVECQAELEKRQHHNSARPQITSLFGLTEEETESEEEDTIEAN